MSLSILSVQLLTGLTYGMLFFLIAVGLSIILGVMNIVNLSHGTFFMLGGYISFSLLNEKVSFWLAIVVSVIAMAVFGVIIERFLLKNSYGKELEQVLLTFGLAFVLADGVKWIWGTDLHMLPTPELLNYSIPMGNVAFPVYRLFVVLVGAVIAVFLWYMETRTRIGSMIRAGVDDREMVSALGIKVNLLFSGVFAFGAGLAGLSGVLGGPIIGMYPGMDSDILVTSLIVVVIGGLGSWKGSFVSAILVGLIETLGKVWFPALSMVIIFLLMIAVLMIKPSGLFGRRNV